MKSRQPPRLALALLEHCVRGNDALIGDVLEDWPRRSHAWFWGQALFAVFAQGVLGTRTTPRLTAERALIATGMLALLGFYTVVVAIMFHLRVVLNEEPWLARTFPDEWPQFKAQVPRWLSVVPRSGRRGRSLP